MKLSPRLISFAVLLFAASPAWAANAAPGMEVVAIKDSTTVFRGITDQNGRFETGPLEPGIYTIQVRIPQTMQAMPARYFLALGGGRPLGEARIGPGVAVAMNAQVRSSAGIRGQVSAIRMRIVAAPTPTPTPARSFGNGNVSARYENAPPARTQVPRPTPSPIVRVATTQSVATYPTPVRTQVPRPNPTPVARVATTQPVVTYSPAASTQAQSGFRTWPTPTPAPVKVANPQSTPTARFITYQPASNVRPSATPIANRGSTVVSTTAANTTAVRPQVPKPTPVPYARVVTTTSGVVKTSPTPARPQSTANTAPARTASAPLPSPTPMTSVSATAAQALSGYPPKIINGRRYFWVPSTPGGTMGHWIPEAVSHPASTPVVSSSVPKTQPSPRPSATPRR